MSEAQPTASMQPSSTEITKNLDAQAAPQPEEAKPAELGTPKQEEKKEDFDYASRFAALSRREKQLIEKERKLKEIESKYKEKDSNFMSWEEKKALFKKNPDAIFEEMGMSFDELVNFKLGLATQEEQKSNDPNEIYKKLKADLQADLEAREKAKAEAEEKARAEREEQENSQIIESFKSEMVETIKKNADKYELINYQQNFDLVFDVIQQYFDEHDEVLPIERAADHVEQYLESLVEGATKLKKFQSKLAPKQESSQPAENAPKTESAKEQSPKTLSNALNSQNSSFTDQTISIEESKRRAAALLRWS